jgi:hypothetical protein
MHLELHKKEKNKMDLNSFLIWLSGAGALVAASWVLGQFGWYVALAEKAKQWIFFALAVLLGGGSFAIVKYVPQATLDAIAPYFLIVAFAFIAIFINKTYTLVKAFGKNLEALDKRLSNFLLDSKAKSVKK